MRRETLGWILVVVGVGASIPVIINGIVIMVTATRGSTEGILNRIRFEREMRKGMKEGRILKLHGEYFTILEDGTKD